MGNSFTITQIKSADGTVKAFRSYEASENSSDIDKKKNADGSESVFTKLKIKDKNGNEKYMYVEAEETSRTVVPEAAIKDPSKLPTFRSMGETKYDIAVDAVTDGVLGIDNSKPSTDGKDDGKISGWDKFKHFCKGAFAPVKNIIKHPFKTLGTGLIIGAALKGLAAIGLGAVTAVAGPVMLVAGLAIGIGTLAYGAVKANTAKTDGDAKAAWENIGTGTITTVLSAIGLRKMYKAAHAKTKAFPESNKYSNVDKKAVALQDDVSIKGKDLTNARKGYDYARKQLAAANKTLKDTERAVKITVKKEDVELARKAMSAKKAALTKATNAKKAQDILDLKKQEFDKAKSTYEQLASKWIDKQKGVSTVGEAQQIVADAKTALNGAEKALAQAESGLKQAQDALAAHLSGNSAPQYTGLAKKVTDVKNMLHIDSPKRLTLPQGNDCLGGPIQRNNYDGIKEFGRLIKTQAGFRDVRGANMSTVKDLTDSAMTHIHNGHHTQAAEAISRMKGILNGGNLSETDAAATKDLISAATKLLKETKAVNTLPSQRVSFIAGGNIGNASDDSATAWTRLGDNAYTVASAS